MKPDTRDGLIDRACGLCRRRWRGSAGDLCPVMITTGAVYENDRYDHHRCASEDYGPVFLGRVRVFAICNGVRHELWIPRHLVGGVTEPVSIGYTISS